MTKPKPLRTALKELLGQEQLTTQELNALQSLEQAPKLGRRQFIWGCAASFSAAVGLAAYSFRHHHQQQLQQDILQSIAQEVLTNHLKIKPLDIETGSIHELSQHLDRLDFTPFHSRLVQQTDFQLVGGRYCTLQGHIACQQRLRAHSGATASYYQAKFDAQRFGPIPEQSQGEKPAVVLSHGFKMQLWREHQVLNVLATAMA